MKQLGKYELLEPLGSGATADVYHARDTVLDREVALKVLKPALVVDSSSFDRFIQEARFAAKLFHDAIATVLDMGEAEGRYFIAMRYIPGRSLDKILKENGPLPWDEVVRLAHHIGEALDFAHSKGFLHRDVKPSNIIRTPESDFVLTDFGLTRAMMSTGLTSHTGAVLGTPPYIAPEVWDGKPAVPATDQYALACVIFEAITGKVLFSGDTPPAIMTRHVLKGAEFPKNWPEGVPEKIEEVLRKALARDPEDRYPDMAVFTLALERIQRGENLSIIASPRQPKPISQPHRPLPWRLWALIAGVILGLAVVFYGFSLLFKGTKPGNLTPLVDSSMYTLTKTTIIPLSEVTTSTTPSLTFTPTTIILPTKTDTIIPTATNTATPTIIHVMDLKFCQYSSEDICIYTYGTAGGSMMITLKVSGLPLTSIYLNVSTIYSSGSNGTTFECDRVLDYPDRFYCRGPQIEEGSKVTISVHDAGSSQLLAEGIITIMRSTPTTTPTPQPSGEHPPTPTPQPTGGYP